MDFGPQQVDYGKHAGHDKREERYPAQPPAPIDEAPHEKHEEGVPKARFAHGAQGRAAEAAPQQADKRAQHGEGKGRQPQRGAALLPEGGPGTRQAEAEAAGGEGEKGIPGNHGLVRRLEVSTCHTTPTMRHTMPNQRKGLSPSRTICTMQYCGSGLCVS